MSSTVRKLADNSTTGRTVDSTPTISNDTTHHHLPPPRASPEEVRHAAGSQSLERLQRAVLGWTAYELDEELTVCSTTTTSAGQGGNNGKSALHQAAWKGCVANVKFLVEDMKCNINAYSKAHYSYGKTAIFFALTQCRVDVVEYLLTVPHMKVTIVNNKGQSVRSLAASHDMPPYILHMIQQLEQQEEQEQFNHKDTNNNNNNHWWNFRASHSDGWEYGDVDPRFLDRPLRPDDVISDHAINLTSQRTRPGGFARRNPTKTTSTTTATITTTSATIAAVAAPTTVPSLTSNQISRLNSRTRRRTSKNNTTSTLTDAEEIRWKETLQLFQQRQQQQQLQITSRSATSNGMHGSKDDDIFVEGLVTIVTLGTKQQRPWIPQVVEAWSVEMAGQEEEPIREGGVTCAIDAHSWFGTIFDKAMIRIQTNSRESDAPSADRLVTLLRKLQDKTLLSVRDNPQTSVVTADPPGLVSSKNNTNSNSNKRDTERQRNHSRQSQARDIWHSHVGQRAREHVAGLSLRRDLEHDGTAWPFLQLPKVPRLVDTLADLKECMRELTCLPLVAVDTEWMDCSSNDDEDIDDRHYQLSTIQVSYVHLPSTNVVQALIVDLKPALSSADYMDTARDMISSIFEESDTLVLGFSIGHDLNMLEHFLGRKLQPTATILDLQLLLGEGTLGLKACVAKYSHTPLSKEEQCSDWGQRPLSARQLYYAGLDAAILLYLLAAYDDPLLPKTQEETTTYLVQYQ
jgi:3'-5' exonuclease/Ankyrin repeats (3 copies)